MDDNSSDSNLKPILSKYADHPQIHVSVSEVQPQDRMKKCRYSVLINEALAMSQGDYITYLTDDDIFLHSRFDIMIELIEASIDVHVVYGSQYLQYGDDMPHEVRWTKGILDDAYDIVDHNSVMHCRHIYEEVGGWTEDPAHWRGADGQYWRKITGAGYLFYPVRGITEVHRFHINSVRHKLLEQGLTDLN